jgi:hypothetical protein
MALDGWEAEVIALARATPNVLVRDVDDGPLVVWLLTSGLTQEEAALIQPGYYPPTGDAVALSALIVPGASLDRDGYRYENFAFSASSTGGAAAPTAAQMGLSYGWPPVSTSPGNFCFGLSPGCVLRPDTLWFGVFGSPTLLGGSLWAGTNESISFNIDYDVVALAAGLAVGGTETFFIAPYYGGFQNLLPGSGSIANTLDNGVLGSLVLDYPPLSFGNRDESILLAAPVERVRVRHSVQIANGQGLSGFDSVVLRAAAVPLPGSVGLLALSFAILGRCIRRRDSAPGPA